MSEQPFQPLDDALSPIPSTWALKFTESVVQYAQELWAAALELPGAPEPAYDKSVINTEVRDEVRHLVSQFAQATRNQCECLARCARTCPHAIQIPLDGVAELTMRLLEVKTAAIKSTKKNY